MRSKTSRWTPVLWALGLYAIWTLATWLLEGRIRTFQRPDEPGARLVYTLTANVLIGTVGAGLLVRGLLRRTGTRVRQFGAASPARTLTGILLGAALGFGFYLLQQPPTLDATILTNALAQVWVVSAAEVLVCWVVLGNSVEISAQGSLLWRRIIGWLVAATAFGAYHFAHSPPFNSMRLVAMLTVVGLVTGAFFLLVRDLYGTIVFHSFLALRGITGALAEGGRLDAFERLQPALIATAFTAIAILIGTDLLAIRRANHAVPQVSPSSTAL